MQYLHILISKYCTLCRYIRNGKLFLLLLVEDVGRIAATDNTTMEAINYYYREYESKMEYLWDLRDTRVDGYFMMHSIWPTLAIVCLYVYIVKFWGPNFMKDRKPYNINTFLIFYNALQVIVSAYLFIQVCYFFKFRNKILPQKL